MFGYNEEAVKYYNAENGDEKEEREGPALISDSVTNRVAGMTLKCILQDHKDAVTGVTCFSRDGGHWLVSKITSGNPKRLFYKNKQFS